MEMPCTSTLFFLYKDNDHHRLNHTKNLPWSTKGNQSKSINQSINQSIKSIHPSIHPSINQSINQIK